MCFFLFLFFIHSVHRDLKPQNILLQWDGDKNVVKLADFGLSNRVKPCGSVSVSDGRRKAKGWTANELYIKKDCSVVSEYKVTTLHGI